MKKKKSYTGENNTMAVANNNNNSVFSDRKYFVFPQPNQNGIPLKKGDFSGALVRVRFVPRRETKTVRKQKRAREK